MKLSKSLDEFEVVVVHGAEARQLLDGRLTLVQQNLYFSLKHFVLGHLGNSTRTLDAFFAVQAGPIRTNTGDAEGGEVHGLQHGLKGVNRVVLKALCGAVAQRIADGRSLPTVSFDASLEQHNIDG